MPPIKAIYANLHLAATILEIATIKLLTIEGSYD